MPSGATATPSVSTRPPSKIFSSLASGETTGSASANPADNDKNKHGRESASVTPRVCESEYNSFPLGLKRRAVEHFWIHDAARHAALRQVDHSLADRPADVAKQLVRPGDASAAPAARCRTSANAGGAVDRLAIEAIDRGAGDAAFAQRASRAASSTMPPRAVLIRYAVGFIRPSSRAPIRFRVCSLSGQWIETKSASASNSSSDTGRARRRPRRPLRRRTDRTRAAASCRSRRAA